MKEVTFEELVDLGAIQTGHFVLSSGLHSNVYIEKFRVLENPLLLARLCFTLADAFRPYRITHVAGPATGGMIVAFQVATILGAQAVYIESENGVKMLRRDKTLPKTARVLIVDDVVTTGQSMLECTEVIESHGATVVGVATIFDRRPDKHEGLLPAAIRFNADVYEPDEIPAWLQAIPVRKPGTRVVI